MKKIFLYNEGISFRLNEKNKLREWIVQSIRKEQKKTGEIHFIFCSDDYLLQINQQFLHHDYYTDVITFDYSKDEIISGDIFISVDRVKENALKNNARLSMEIKRVMIHGVLHLIGYKDNSKIEKEKMTLLEDNYLSLFLNI